MNRTVGTQQTEREPEKESPAQAVSELGGKPPIESRTVMRSEIQVAKSAEPLSRKAAIVLWEPVP